MDTAMFHGNSALKKVILGVRSLITISLFFLSHLCYCQSTLHGVYTINEYSAVLSFSPCGNKLVVEDGFLFSMGDTVLIIQMKGAVVDSSNTAAFGTITRYGNSGNFEFNTVRSVSGNSIILENNLIKKYDIPFGAVQLIRVPSYSNLGTSATDIISSPAWDGKKGGVVAVIVNDTLTLNEDIDVGTKGFRGGLNRMNVANAAACSQIGYFYDSSSNLNGGKGEGIANLNSDKWNGRGKLANGGGGGNGHNSGGGGGSNSTPGGYGGYQLDSCGSSPFDNRGMPGMQLNYNNQNKIFFGGGGGAGHTDDPNPNTRSSGGTGGGIVIIKAKYLQTNDHNIIADGVAGEYCLSCNDGMGGGGAAGTVLLDVNTFIDSVSISVTGGDGSHVLNYSNPSERTGPGGGGSGGVVWFRGATSSVARIRKSGGLNGAIVPDSFNPWGATPGTDGTVMNNLSLLFDSVPFLHNIDSVRIKDSATSCNNYTFKGLVYLNTFPVAKWKWDFGDGTIDTIQNTSHYYLTTGNFTVKLFVTDTYGCTESFSKQVTSSYLQIDAGTDTTVCRNQPVYLSANIGGATQFSWMPAEGLNDNTLLNPVATPSSTKRYYLIANNGQGCSKIDSVLIRIFPLPPVRAAKSNDIDCSNDYSLLTATGASMYIWSPATALNDPSTANPIATPVNHTKYILKGTDANGCVNYDSLTVFITSLNNAGFLLPLAFSPNGDGINDCYGIRGWGHIEQLSFNIYNRWGQLVFHTSKPGDCWDGNYKGQKESADAYVYMITAKTACGTVSKKGSLVLIR